MSEVLASIGIALIVCPLLKATVLFNGMGRLVAPLIAVAAGAALVALGAWL